MTNPLVTVLVALWLVLDAAWFIAFRTTTLLVNRGSFRGPATAASQAIVAICALLAWFGPDPVASVAFWLLLGVVNVLVGTSALEKQRVAALSGLVATLAAWILILAHSFASLWLMLLAGVICLAAAVLGHRDASRDRTASA